MNVRSFHLSAQGASHIRKNKECQDFSLSLQGDGCVIAVVCDGHGGSDYIRSAVGSRAGCEAAGKNIKEFFLAMDTETFFLDPERRLRDLEGSIINDWNKKIAAYHQENPFTDSELEALSERARRKYVRDGKIESAYGTTLLAVGMNHDYWFGIHIGDGKCVAVSREGEFEQPIPWDPKCFLNATTSICDSDAIGNFRHFYSRELPAAVFIGSDGVDDCFSSSEQLHNLYKTVLYSFATEDFDKACRELGDYLPRLSARGSGDDVSIAALLDMDRIRELPAVREFDREKEKARVEENARREAERNEAEKKRVEEEHARFQQQHNMPQKEPERRRTPGFCRNCGERIDPGDNFCWNCGARIRYADKVRDNLSDSDDVEEIKILQVREEKADEEEPAVSSEEESSGEELTVFFGMESMETDAESCSEQEDADDAEPENPAAVCEDGTSDTCGEQADCPEAEEAKAVSEESVKQNTDT